MLGLVYLLLVSAVLQSSVLADTLQPGRFQNFGKNQLLKRASSSVGSFTLGTTPVLLNAGQSFTTTFDNATQIGTQFAVYVPQNASRIHISWTRSATTASCGANTYAYLYAKWGTFPCYYNAYSDLDSLCNNNAMSLGYSTGSEMTATLNAYDTKQLSYWKSPYGSDFVTGDYLYLASYLDSAGSCIATVNVSFDYCPANTIAAESTGDTKCVAYKTVTSTHYTESVTVTTVPFEQYWLVTVPQNCSGVRATVTNPNGAFLGVFSRTFSGASQYNYYQRVIDSKNMVLWSPNPAAGQLVISVISQAANVTNFQFGITIDVITCPAGYTADASGNCTCPFKSLTATSMSSTITVSVPATSTAGVCNWRVYGWQIPAWTSAFFNLTVDENQGTGLFFIRKNAWPTNQIYDDYSTTSWVWNFTPEDFYVSKPTWWYIGFCNDVTATSSWTMSGTYKAYTLAAAPSPSASASPGTAPVEVPSASPSSGTIATTPSSSPAPGSNPSPTVSASPAVQSPDAQPSSSPLPTTSVEAQPSSSGVPPSDEIASSGSANVMPIVLMIAAVLLVC